MQLIEKLCFYKIEQIFNPYPPLPLSHGKGENTGTGVPALARMLVVSHTQSLHDATTQTG